jgi:hypothetical protein
MFQPNNASPPLMTSNSIELGAMPALGGIGPLAAPSFGPREVDDDAVGGGGKGRVGANQLTVDPTAPIGNGSIGNGEAFSVLASRRGVDISVNGRDSTNSDTGMGGGGGRGMGSGEIPLPASPGSPGEAYRSTSGRGNSILLPPLSGPEGRSSGGGLASPGGAVTASPGAPIVPKNWGRSDSLDGFAVPDQKEHKRAGSGISAAVAARSGSTVGLGHHGGQSHRRPSADDSDEHDSADNHDPLNIAVSGSVESYAFHTTAAPAVAAANGDNSARSVGSTFVAVSVPGHHHIGVHTNGDHQKNGNGAPSSPPSDPGSPGSPAQGTGLGAVQRSRSTSSKRGTNLREDERSDTNRKILNGIALLSLGTFTAWACWLFLLYQVDNRSLYQPFIIVLMHGMCWCFIECESRMV